MKKILLVLISGLILLGVAGAASAQSIVLIDPITKMMLPNPLPLNPGQSFTVGGNITNLVAGDEGGTSGSITILPQNGGSATDITTTFNNPTITPADTSAGFIFSNNLFTMTMNSNVPVGRKYLVIYSLLSDTFSFSVTASNRVVAVPEFPTIAAPVGALLGLVYIFGRKKEKL